MNDAELAADLASKAGYLLVALRTDLGFGDEWRLRDAGDQRAHDLLVAELAAARPDDVVLSEEGRDDPARLVADRLWIVDPLDGTSEYGEVGRTDWAVHVALWERHAAGWHGGLTAGAVALPARGTTLSTAGPLPPVPAAGPRPRLAVSRSRRPPWIGAVADQVGGVPVPIGSAGMKAMAVLLGEADAYVHRGAMKEWDSAAPVAVAAAAGLHVSDFSGRPLSYNKRDRLTRELVICRPELAAPLLEAIGSALAHQT